MMLKALVGSGDKTGLFTLPFLLVGLVLNLVFPAAFDVAGPPPALRVASVVALIIGVVIWAWSAALIVANVFRGRLITTGPFAVVKHPLYTSVALLVLPSIGLLLNTWLGAAIGCVMYIGSRMFARPMAPGDALRGPVGPVHQRRQATLAVAPDAASTFGGNSEGGRGVDESVDHLGQTDGAVELVRFTDGGDRRGCPGRCRPRTRRSAGGS